MTLFSIGIFALVLIDMWQVDKRYLKDANFQEKQDSEQVVKPREVDLLINQINVRNPDPDFRVFDYSDYSGIKQDTFNPFFHKSISGYFCRAFKTL